LTLKGSELPIGPMFKSSQLAATTGSWRVKMPVLNREKCNKCLLCWVYCPDGTVSIIDEGITFDLDYCKGCGICAVECPKHAVTMVEEG